MASIGQARQVRCVASIGHVGCVASIGHLCTSGSAGGSAGCLAQSVRPRKQGSLPNSAQCCVSLVAPQREQRSVFGPCSALGHGSAQDGHMGYHLGHVITSRRLKSARVHLQRVPDRMLWRFQRPHHVSDRGGTVSALVHAAARYKRRP